MCIRAENESMGIFRVHFMTGIQGFSCNEIPIRQTEQGEHYMYVLCNM